MASPRIVHLGQGHYKQLFARRVSSLFTPSDNGTDSADGKIEWHTEWWFFLNGVKVASERGPILERSFAQLIGVPVGVIADKSRQVFGHEMLSLNKALFEMVADEDLAPVETP